VGDGVAVGRSVAVDVTVGKAGGRSVAVGVAVGRLGGGCVTVAVGGTAGVVGEGWTVNVAGGGMAASTLPVGVADTLVIGPVLSRPPVIRGMSTARIATMRMPPALQAKSGLRFPLPSCDG